MNGSPAYSPKFIPQTALRDLVALLLGQGYTPIAPVVVEGVIVLRPISSAEQIARGVHDEQQAGQYRLVAANGELIFQYVVGPDGPKRFLFPPQQQMAEFRVRGEQFVLDASPPSPQKPAFIGIRPCEIAALAVQDRVFGAGDVTTMRCESETYYTESRRQALIIAVNCTLPGGTCFCASMNTGPEVSDGFDLALTELRGGFILAIGSDRGAELAKSLPVRAPTSAELELAELKMAQARQRMGRRLETARLNDRLRQGIEDPNWSEVARRCLSCGNCTMVCPTCFCSTVNDSTDISGARLSRTRQWASCFTHEFSYTTSGPVRNTIRARYRHWLRHKLGTWWDQFGCSGCVGCGRCITWCPVGIDLTVEAQRIRGQVSPSSNPPQEASQ